MSKPTSKSSAAQTLPAIIQSRYGVSPIEADALTIEWAAEHMAQSVGAERAAKAWKALNAKRHAWGRHTTIPQWGSPLFVPYFA